MKDRGLTLIELVAAMAIFALVATMGLQSLSGTLRARDTLDDRFDAVRALGHPLALLRNDLTVLVPLVFYTPGVTQPQSALWQSRDGQALGLSIAGQVGLGRDGSVRRGDMHRAIWRVDPVRGVLTRQRWDSLTPASATQRGPEVDIMQGVQAMRVRSHWPRSGWRPGVASGDIASADPADGDGDARSAVTSLFGDMLPQAVEVTLVLTDGREIPLLESLQ
ncbi:MAG: type II secretion system protein GspJ [Pseudomonadota bacterium]